MSRAYDRWRARLDDEGVSPEACRALFQAVERVGTGGGRSQISLRHRRSGAATWARTRIHVAADRTEVELLVRRTIDGAEGAARTTRLDDEGLREVVRAAEYAITFLEPDPDGNAPPAPDAPMLHPTLWSDRTARFDADARADVVRRLIAPAEERGVLSAGTLDVGTVGEATVDSGGLFRYYPATDVRCSVTVRDRAGTASGWAGVNHYTLDAIDPIALNTRAIEKCVASAKPSALEPGRYTTILEPQAVNDLLAPLVDDALGRPPAENNMGPFAKSPGYSKIGDVVFDRRLTLRADPMDPDGGFIPFTRWTGEPFQPVSWIDDGVLRELAYDRRYAIMAMGRAVALPSSGSYRLRGGSATVAEMIASTERGLLVTRFSGVTVLDRKTMLCSGYTRDGVWLIERGVITKPVKNFRFTESPMFAFNTVDAVGAPVRVFDPPYARLAPPVKVRDFSFTALADAV